MKDKTIPENKTTRFLRNKEASNDMEVSKNTLIKKYFTNSYYTVFIVIAIALYSFILMFLSKFISIPMDSADHWVWSLKLFLSYYEHPPMIALAIRLITTIFPTSNIPYLLFASSVFFFAIFLLLTFFFVAYLYNKKTALVAMILLMLTPYLLPGGLFLSINILMLIFWVIGLHIITIFIRTKNPNWLLVFGLVAGLGGLSKYIYVFLCIAFVLFILLNRDYWFLFKRYQLYVMPVIAIVVFMPVIIWNFQNDFVSILFGFNKGFSGTQQYTGILAKTNKLLMFTVGHILLFSPFLAFYGVYLAIRRRLRFEEVEAENLLKLSALVPFVAFSLISFFMSGYTDSNWLDVSYLALIILVARYIQDSTSKIIKLSIAMLLYAILLIGLLFFSFYVLFPIYGKGFLPDRITSLFKWQESGEEVELYVKKYLGFVPKYMILDDYQIAGAMSLYMNSHPLPYSVRRWQRNQWVDTADMKSNGFLLICRENKCNEDKHFIEEKFAMKESKLLFIHTTTHSGIPIRELNVYYYNGIKAKN